MVGCFMLGLLQPMFMDNSLYEESTDVCFESLTNNSPETWLLSDKSKKKNGKSLNLVHGKRCEKIRK